MDELKNCEHEYFFGDGFRQCVKCFQLETKNGEIDETGLPVYILHKKQPGKMIIDTFIQSEVIEDDEEVIEPEIVEDEEDIESDLIFEDPDSDDL